jgi:hypothetical protein
MTPHPLGKWSRKFWKNLNSLNIFLYDLNIITIGPCSVKACWRPVLPFPAMVEQEELITGFLKHSPPDNFNLNKKTDYVDYIIVGIYEVKGDLRKQKRIIGSHWSRTLLISQPGKILKE